MESTWKLSNSTMELIKHGCFFFIQLCFKIIHFEVEGKNNKMLFNSRS